MNTRVNFELAKLLKEKGFDEKVRGRYCIKNITPFKVGLFYLSDYELSGEFIYGPTIAETIMWLYEKHGIWIYPLPIDDDMKLWQARIIKGEPFSKVGNTLKIISHGEISYKGMYSPTEAYEAAIEYTLKNLI